MECFSHAVTTSSITSPFISSTMSECCKFQIELWNLIKGTGKLKCINPTQTVLIYVPYLGIKVYLCYAITNKGTSIKCVLSYTIHWHVLYVFLYDIWWWSQKPPKHVTEYMIKHIYWCAFVSLLHGINIYIHPWIHTHIHISQIHHPLNDSLNMKLVVNNIGFWYTVWS